MFTFIQRSSEKYFDGLEWQVKFKEVQFLSLFFGLRPRVLRDAQDDKGRFMTPTPNIPTSVIPLQAGRRIARIRLQILPCLK